MSGNDGKPSFWYSLKAVLWSFVGLRRKSDYDKDSVKLNPFHVILAGLLAAALFIGILVTVVKLVVS